jgi:hypothetical protein
MQTNFWNDAVLEPLRRFADQAFGFLTTNLLAMVTVLAIGVLVAYLVRLAVRLLLGLVRFDRLCERQGVTGMLRAAGIDRPPSAAAARLAYWLVVFLFLLFSLAALNVGPMNDLVSRVFLFIPQALAAVIILALGYLTAAFLQRATLLAAVNAGLPRARVLASTVQILAILFTVAVALEQVGIGRTIVFATFTVAFGSVGLAAALAFGYAARDLARAVLERQLAPPDGDQLGDISHL